MRIRADRLESLRLRRFAPSPSLLLVFLLLPFPAAALTEVGGTISTDTTWTQAGSPYVVTSSIQVVGTARLTIEPGVIVKVGLGNGIDLPTGVLSALGTSASPIVFTSILDDSAGGDTNGDGDATHPMPGDWRGLWANPLTSGPPLPSFDLDHVEIAYAGGPVSAPNAAVGFSYGTLSISDSTIRKSAKLSANVWAPAAVSIRDTDFRDNAEGLQIDGANQVEIDGSRFLDTGSWIPAHVGTSLLSRIERNVGIGNTPNEMELSNCRVAPSGAVLGPSTPGFPFVVEGLWVDDGRQLTIAPGTTIKGAMESYGIVLIGLEGAATLSAVGLPGQPIRFTSLRDDSMDGDTNGDGGASSPAPGDLPPVQARSLSGARPSAVFDHLELAWGGTPLPGTSQAALDAYEGGDLTIDHSLFRNCRGNAIRVWTGDSFVLRNSEFRDNFREIWIETASLVELRRNVFDGSTTDSPSMISRSTISAIERNRGIGAPSNGLELSACTTTANALVTGGGTDALPLVAHGDWERAAGLVVPDGGRLEIGHGTIFKSGNGSSPNRPIHLTGTATLEAIGSREEPIVFTSYLDDSVAGDTNGDGGALSPAPGNWEGIGTFNLFSGSPTMRLRNVDLRYGMYTILAPAGNIRLDGCRIVNSADGGINVDSLGGAASVIVHDSEILSNAGTAIRVNGSLELCNSRISGNSTGVSLRQAVPSAVGHGNDISGNASAGVTAYDAAHADFRFNWWGDPSGPSTTDPSACVSGLGDRVTCNVDVTGFYSAPLLAASSLDGAIDPTFTNVVLDWPNLFKNGASQSYVVRRSESPRFETETQLPTSTNGLTDPLSSTPGDAYYLSGPTPGPPCP
jgi:hypothetical protein